MAFVDSIAPLINLTTYIIFQEGSFAASGLGLGGLERWIAYPLVLWLVVFGGYLLGTRPDDLQGHDTQCAVA